MYIFGLKAPATRIIFIAIFCLATFSQAFCQQKKDSFWVIAFFTAKHDAAHISFVGEANPWFSKMGKQYNFKYDTTSNWNNLNDKFLSSYQVIIFLDTRPEDPKQRAAFETFMKNGGAWMGFHFAGFALTPSDYPQNWDWYHNEFIGAGSYASNTWRPTSAILRVEEIKHPSTSNLSEKFTSAPSEWYRWENDLTKNAAIKILLSVDPSSFPLGTKQDETWHEGYYPIAWTNTNYKMTYTNMGHNDIDYENKTNKTLSSTFSSEQQNQFILDALLWLGNGEKK
jgi:hypothetical protein